MSNEIADDTPRPDPAAAARADHTIGSSTIYRLCEEVIALREMNNRQHKLFEQSLTKARDELRASFNSFAGDTQRAYQQLRQEVHGEKRISLALLNELLDLGMELEHITASRPSPEDREAVVRWMEAVEVQNRKVQAALARHGIQPYDAILGADYNPAIHERISSEKAEGMGPLHIAGQRERGYASQQPEFVLRRPKVIVSE
jgi:molecular chaperone GrpE (heat shock protein)